MSSNLVFVAFGIRAEGPKKVRGVRAGQIR